MRKDDLDDETSIVMPRTITTGAAASSDAKPYLIVLAGTNVGAMLKVDAPALCIGRDEGVDIRVVDSGISRRHALIETGERGTFVTDLESRNGTFVNGERITRAELRDGDKIQFGSTTILKFSYADRLDETFQLEMYQSALRDGLTKAFNKKYFGDQLEAEFRFAQRHKMPLSLVLFDVDHFKRINDTYGHLAGDTVLAAVAGRIQETIRIEDIFARYGGEEFVVLCRATDSAQAAMFAQRLRLRIAAREFEHEGQAIAVTISIGVASYPEVNMSDATGLIHAADQALYAAKEAGRNRVEIARQEPPQTPT